AGHKTGRHRETDRRVASRAPARAGAARQGSLRDVGRRHLPVFKLGDAARGRHLRDQLHAQRAETREGPGPTALRVRNQARPRYPFLIIDSYSWRGPIITEEEQRRRAEYVAQQEGDFEQVRAGLAKLATRALRRPVSDLELERYLRLIKSEMTAGEKFRDAV